MDEGETGKKAKTTPDAGGKSPELNLKQTKRNDRERERERVIHTLSIASLTHLSLSLTPPKYRSWLVHLHDVIPFPSLPTINQLLISQTSYHDG